jgi:hypothetical protein
MTRGDFEVRETLRIDVQYLAYGCGKACGKSPFFDGLIDSWTRHPQAFGCFGDSQPRMSLSFRHVHQVDKCKPCTQDPSRAIEARTSSDRSTVPRNFLRAACLVLTGC